MTFNDLTYHEYHANAQYAKLYTLQKTLTFSKDDEYYRGWKKNPHKKILPLVVMAHLNDNPSEMCFLHITCDTKSFDKCVAYSIL